MVTPGFIPDEDIDLTKPTPGFIPDEDIDLTKPIIKQEPGVFSTEKTITAEFDGQFYNIPTIIKGKEIPESEAIEYFKKTGEHVGVFETLGEAVNAAKERSKRIGELRGKEAKALGPTPGFIPDEPTTKKSKLEFLEVFPGPSLARRIPIPEERKIPDYSTLFATAGGVGGSLLAAPLLAAGPIGMAGTVAAGAFGAGAGEAIGEYMEMLGKGEEVSVPKLLEEGRKEAQRTAIIDVATLGAFKAGELGGKALFKTAKKLGQPIRKIKAINKAVSRTEKQIAILKNKLAKSETLIKIRKPIAETIEQIKKSVKEKKIETALKDTISEKNKIIMELSGPMAKGTTAAKKRIGKQYDELAKQFGDVPLSIEDALDDIFSIVEREGLEAFDTSAINKLNRIKKITTTEIEAEIPGEAPTIIMNPTSVKDVMQIRRMLGDVQSSIFRSSKSAAKGTVGQELKGIIKSIDGQLDDATEGATALLNKRTREIAEIEDLSSGLIKGTLGSDIKEKYAKELSRMSLDDFARQAAKSGDDFLRITREEVQNAIAGGEPIFNVGNRRALSLLNQTEALRRTGDKRFIKLANHLDERLFNLAESALSEKRIAKTLTDLRKAKPAAFAAEDLNKLANNIRKEIVAKETRLSKLKAGLETRENRVINAREAFALYLTGNSISALAFGAGFPKIAASITGITHLATLRNWSPMAADLLAREIKSTRGLLTKLNISPANALVINKFLDELEDLIP